MVGLLVIRRRLGTARPAPDEEEPPTSWQALRRAWRAPGTRAVLLLLAAQAFLVGSLDLLVLVAIQTTRSDGHVAGWFTAAAGVGEVLGATVCAVLVGRRLGLTVGVAAPIGAAIALVLLAVSGSVVLVGAAFALVGIFSAILLTASRTLLDRLSDAEMLGHAFAFAEASESAVLLVAAMSVPLLLMAGGPGFTFAIIAASLILTTMLVARPLIRAEQLVAERPAESPLPAQSSMTTFPCT